MASFDARVASRATRSLSGVPGQWDPLLRERLLDVRGTTNPRGSWSSMIWIAWAKVYGADEAFVTGTFAGVTPVAEVITGRECTTPK